MWHTSGTVFEHSNYLFKKKRDQIEEISKKIKKIFISAEDKKVNAILNKPLGREYSLFEVMKRPEIKGMALLEAAGLKMISSSVAELRDCRGRRGVVAGACGTGRATRKRCEESCDGSLDRLFVRG